MSTHRRFPILPGALAFVLLVGCAGRHPASVSDFRDFLSVRGPVTEQALVATFFEVGLGDAILLEFPSGSSLLIDAGVGWYVEFILNYLEARGIKKLDGLLLTHPHQDHYGGMKEVVERIPVQMFFHNGFVSPTSVYEDFLESLASRGIPATVVRRGDELAGIAGPETFIEVLFPEAAIETAPSDPNDASLVLRVRHGDVSFLLVGDAENDEEARLLQLEGKKLKADVLKLGHHGSMLSGSKAFLDAVDPKVAVVQGTQLASVHPFYPRPSYHIRSSMKSRGVPLLNTKKDGTVQIISDGTTIRWQTMRDAEAAIEELPRATAIVP